MNLMGFVVQRNVYAKKEIEKVRFYSLIGVVLILLLFGMEYLEFFRSIWIMILVAGLGAILIIFCVFYSLMILGVIFFRTLELKRGKDSIFLFSLALLFLTLGFVLLKERN
jgi:amino acid transporter